MTRIAAALAVLAAAAIADRPGVEPAATGVRVPVTRVCYLDLAADRADRCRVPPRRAADAS